MKQKSLDLDQHTSDTDDLSNDGAGGSGANASKAKVNLKKFGEDETLGELATQAMSLFSNATYPSLRADMPDLSERFKHVTKLWRKLDAASKLAFVNKSRQNRYKKKSDEKTPATKSSKRSKSPSSDKHSDVEFSRSVTPFAETPENSQQMNDKIRQVNQQQQQQQQQTQVVSLNNSGANQFIPQLNVVKTDESLGFIQLQQQQQQQQQQPQANQSSQPPKIIQLSNNQIPIGLVNNVAQVLEMLNLYSLILDFFRKRNFQ